MKNIITFILYFFLGVFLVFSFKKIDQTSYLQEIKTPLALSSFSLDLAPSKSLRGTIVSLSGEVGWQSRTATQPAQISKLIQIQQGEGIATKDTGRVTVVFSKIADIIIDPETEINFIQTLPTNILIEQNSGTVDYEALNANSLNVRIQNLIIKINKGKVTASINKEQTHITVDVKEGTITAGYNDLNYVTRVVNIDSDNRFTFRTDTKKMSILPL